MGEVANSYLASNLILYTRTEVILQLTGVH